MKLNKNFFRYFVKIHNFKGKKMLVFSQKLTIKQKSVNLMDQLFLIVTVCFLSRLYHSLYVFHILYLPTYHNCSKCVDIEKIRKVKSLYG